MGPILKMTSSQHEGIPVSFLSESKRREKKKHFTQFCIYFQFRVFPLGGPRMDLNICKKHIFGPLGSCMKGWWNLMMECGIFLPRWFQIVSDP